MTSSEGPQPNPQPDKGRYEQARALFDQACSLHPDKREVFVRGRAGKDEVLAREVLELLAREREAATAELRGRAEIAAAPANSNSKSEGDGETLTIGPYRVLRTLGEGGMGTVYLAEQRKPMRRRVALKVLKQGMDSKAFLARFDAERQALAMMEHSCIARIYDAGVTETGQPYLAMEHVKGVPITKYCDDNQLSIESRVELFISVCSAIQHAHTKGVMHRDLKPSNILVTVQDGQPEPKVIDFGLAKAVDHRLVEATVFTEVGQVIGTPEYMSPEQAGVGELDIDMRTDVFSLGVLLYQLLTGALPVTREELLRHGYFEMQRVIREGEMPKPSTKITTLGDGAVAYAKARRLPLGELQKQLRGELDWIVMKAIEKDRGRRYTTVHEMAADLLRHLRDEPVSAGPPSAGYMLRKFAKKHRGPVLAGAGIVVALGVGLALAVWQWREAAAQTVIAEAREDEAKKAKEEADRERDRAEEAKEVADRERDRAKAANAKYLRLEDQGRLRLFERRAAVGWREVASAVDGIQAWIDDVDEWLVRVPDDNAHAGTLVELRSRGRTVDDVWRFADDGDQFVHDSLVEFVHDYKEFRSPNGTLTGVRASLEWLLRVQKETVDDYEREWLGVVGRVSVDPRFKGLVLRPQPGLIPLGRDPHSNLEEFWFARSGGAKPDRNVSGYLQLPPGLGIVLVLVPGGTFRMGSEPGPMVEPIETPVQAVQLSPFLIGKYEMTQAQWKRWAGQKPSKYQTLNSGGHPVETVSWIDATKLLGRHGLALPTEAQWEYACRAGTATQWCFGDDRESLVTDGRGRLNIASDNIPDAEQWPEFQDGFPVHAAAGTFEANGFGLHDMHGNIAEFTRGATSGYGEAKFAPGDGLLLGDETNFVIQRGGSFFKRYQSSRSAARVILSKDGKWDSVGVRVARALDP